MAQKNTIEIAIEAINNAKKELDAATDQIGDMGKAADKSSDDMSTLDGAVQSAKALIGAFAVKELAEAVFELGELGAQAQRTERAFENISGGASNASANLEAMRKATRGAMSDTEAMAQANRLLQMGLVSNSDELGEFTEMAVRLGSAMGGTATESIENFSLMIANQSLPRLDSFGISSGKVRERIAELQAEFPGLSREIAFNRAVMEQGQIAMERIGDATEDNALKVEQGQAAWENLRVEIGMAFSDAVSTAAGETAGLTRSLTEYMAIANDVRDGNTLLEYGVNSATLAFDVLIDSLGGTTIMLDDYRKSQAETAAASNLAAGQMQDYAEMAGQVATANDDAATSTEALTAAESSGAQVREDARVSLLAQAEAAGTLAQRLKDATEGQIASSLIEMLDPEAMGATAYSAAVEEIGLSFGLMDEKSLALAENLPRVAEAIQGGVIPSQDADMALSALVEDAADGVVNFGALLGKFETVPAQAGKAQAGVQNFNPALATTRDTAGAAATTVSEFGQALDALPDEKTVDINVNYHVTGSPGDSGVPEIEQPDIAMANGFSGVFNSPTTAVFGEAGPEYVYAAPVGQAGGVGTTWNGNINISGADDPQAVADAVMARLQAAGIMPAYGLR